MLRRRFVQGLAVAGAALMVTRAALAKSTKTTDQGKASPMSNSHDQFTSGKVTSQDGTSIAYDRFGQGPAVVLVGGGLDDRNSTTAGRPLAAPLSKRCAVYTYDRRGRGESGDTQPYAVDREVEDLEALIDMIGGSAMVYGMSSGCALAIEAAASGLPITKLALYEPPFDAPLTAGPLPEYSKALNALLAKGRRADALILFMKRAGLPDPLIKEIRQSPQFESAQALAPSLAYDSLVMDDLHGAPVPIKRLALIDVPVRVIVGGASLDWWHKTAHAVVEALPNGLYETLDNQTHDVDPEILAPVLSKFFVG